jgi:hypothetical protein
MIRKTLFLLTLTGAELGAQKTQNIRTSFQDDKITVGYYLVYANPQARWVPREL